MYIIKEQLNKNTFAVCLQDNERKNFIVHKNILRPIKTHLAEMKDFATRDLERAVEDPLTKVQENTEEISKVSDKDDQLKIKVEENTKKSVPEQSSRPRRQAALNARNKMKTMK